jgi:hypothetical protein
MQNAPLYPLQDEADYLTRHCRLSVHLGKAKIGSQLAGNPNDPFTKLFEHLNHGAPTLADVEFDAAFLMPLAGNCLIFLQCQPDFRLDQTYGYDLIVKGDSEYGPSALHCPQFYVKSEGEGPGDRNWAIAKIVNAPATLRAVLLGPSAGEAKSVVWVHLKGGDPDETVRCDFSR